MEEGFEYIAKKLANGSITLEEFKAIINRQDMSKEDKDKIIKLYNYISKVNDEAENITTIDLNKFIFPEAIHNFNEIDFTDVSQFSTVNTLFKTKVSISKPIVNTKEEYIRDIRKLLKFYLKNYSNIVFLNGIDTKLNYKPNILIANVSEIDLNPGDIYASRFNMIIGFMHTNAINTETRGIDLPNIKFSGLFYTSNDAAPNTPINSRANANISIYSNYLYHVHLILLVDPSAYLLRIVDGDDEFIANIPFCVCVSKTNLPVDTVYDYNIGIYTEIELPRQLDFYEITKIVNNTMTYSFGEYENIKPWGHSINGDKWGITNGEVYLPAECGVRKIVISNNQITEIIYSK